MACRVPVNIFGRHMLSRHLCDHLVKGWCLIYAIARAAGFDETGAKSPKNP
jgi:hypothetical protein